MMTLRRAAERGRTQIDWLDSRHTFSFGGYVDPRHMGFRSLRVLNEDRVEPGAGFPPHAHRDMEIVSYVLSGALEHRDSPGNGSVIRPGEVQRMSAGTGIRHSEYNASDAEPVHFLQIWILPERPGIAPGYEQKAFDLTAAQGQWRVLASRDGRDGSLTLHQDVSMLGAILPPGGAIDYAPAAGRHTWLQVARGAVEIDGHALEAGDGAAMAPGAALRARSERGTELLLFDLA